MEKYFLMENYDIVESEIFMTDEFQITPKTNNGIYEIKIIEDSRTVEMDVAFGGKPGPHLVHVVRLSHVSDVIMESDDYESLELFRRLRGH